MAITLEQHIANVKANVKKLLEADRPLFIAAQTALSDLSERVFTNGKTINGGSYQYNSTSPLHANPLKTFGNTSALKPPTGKPYNDKKGRTTFASTGQPHKTTWVESYKALRGLVGRETAFVNLVATGDLKSDVENRAAGDVAPHKVSDGYEVRATDVKKIEGLRSKYPGLLQFSESEKQTFYKTFDFEFLKIIREGFNS
jgi:hypothetical protein